MTFSILVKQLGKRKPALAKRPYTLAEWDGGDLRQFIEAMVRNEVQLYNSKTKEQPVLPFLTETQITDAAATGKVGFGTIYHPAQADVAAAIDRAVLAHQDGLFVVFLDGDEVKTLDTPIVLKPESEVTFVRLAYIKPW